MDAYDREIERLTKVYDERGVKSFRRSVFSSWNRFAPLFFACGTVAKPNWFIDCGCLTQVRSSRLSAETPELTQAIRADDRIPFSPKDIDHPRDLLVFAEWQRRLDRELGREVGR